MINYKLLGPGVAIMIVAVLFLIFVDLNVQAIIGVAVLFIIGLGLTVAGSPDPNKPESGNPGAGTDAGKYEE